MLFFAVDSLITELTIVEYNLPAYPTHKFKEKCVSPVGATLANAE